MRPGCRPALTARTVSPDRVLTDAQSRLSRGSVAAQSRLSRESDAMHSLGPVLPAQSGDPGEFGGIGRDDGQPAPECLAGDQQIVSADWVTLLLQGRAYLAGGPGVLVIEFQQI